MCSQSSRVTHIYTLMLSSIAPGYSAKELRTVSHSTKSSGGCHSGSTSSSGSASESTESAPLERKKLDLRQLFVQLGSKQYQFLFAELKHIPVSSKLWSRFPGLSLLFIIPLARCYNSSMGVEMELSGVFGNEIPRIILGIVLEYLGGSGELTEVLTKYRDITSSHFFALSPVGILFTHEREFTSKVHQEHSERSDTETRGGKMICHEAEAIYDRICRTFRGDSSLEAGRFTLSESSFDSEKLSDYLSSLPKKQSHKPASPKHT